MNRLSSEKNQHKICIIGLGYVGLPLAVEFGKKFEVIGFDIDKNRVNDLENSNDKTLEVGSDDLNNANIFFTSDEKDIDESNIYIITVPTPINEKNEPDLNFIISATKLVGRKLTKNNIVIYESTVFPSMTQDICAPELEKQSGLVYNEDFFLGYSPERINPGDKENNIKTIVKVTSGSDEKTADFVNDLYSSIIPAGTYKASSIQVAEASKVIENIQRDVNIALVNELSIIFNKMNIDTKNVLDAASSKWNFAKYTPGLVGGHCIGIDPYYLAFKAKKIGIDAEMILTGRKLNEQMVDFVCDEIFRLIDEINLDVNSVNASIFGVSFKENIPDIRNTKVVDLIHKLNKKMSNVFSVDYLVDGDEFKNLYNITLTDISDIKKNDVIILAAPHREYKNFNQNKWKSLMNERGIIIDIKSAFDIGFFKDENIIHWRL